MDGEKTRRTNRIITTTTTTTRTNDEFFSSSLEEDIGEISALLDNSAAKHKISVRPARSKRSPSVPETRSKQEKEATIRELIETEEEFVRDLKYLVTNYIRWIEDGKTADGKILAPHAHFLFGGIQEIFEFHKTVLLEGMKYYAGQPNQIGRSFIRLERDFDKHANYIDRMESISEFLNENPNVNEAFDNRAIELNDTGRTLIDYIRLPSQRLNDYSLLLSDLIKISKQLGEPTNDLEKGLELVNWIPSKSRDIKFIQSIEGFGDTRVGRILRHDWFRLNLGGREKERYCFLFKNKLLVTKVRRISPDRSVFILKNILQLPEYQLVEIEISTSEGADLKEQGNFGLLDKEGNLYVFQSEASIANAWAKHVQEFTATRPLSDEPVVKKGRIISEVAESVTINGVEITDVTSIQDERSISIGKQVDTNVSRTRRVIDIPIQVESSDDTSLSERIAQENRKNRNLVDVIEIEHINVSVKESVEEEIRAEESQADKTQSLEESDENNETVEEQKELVSEQHDIIQVDSESSSRAPQVVPSESPLIIEESAVFTKTSQVQAQIVSQESSATPESPEESPASPKKSRLESEDLSSKPEDFSAPEKSSISRKNSRIASGDSQIVPAVESSGRTEATSLNTEVASVRAETTSALNKSITVETEITSGQIVSGTTEAVSAHTVVTSGRTEASSAQTKVSASRIEESSLSRQNSRIVSENLKVVLEESTGHLEVTATSRGASSGSYSYSQISSQESQIVPEAASTTLEEISRKYSRIASEEGQIVPEETSSRLEEIARKYSRILSEESHTIPEEPPSRLEEISRKYSRISSQETQVEETSSRLAELSRKYSRTVSEETQVAEPAQVSKLNRRDSEKLSTAAENSKLQSEKVEAEAKTFEVKSEKSPPTEESEVPVQSRKISIESAQEAKRSIKPSKSTSSANLIRMDSTSNEGAKPEFSLNVKSIEVEPGENAVLIVESNSSTPAIVTWLKENKPLEDRLADRVKIVSKENAHTLTLLNVRDDDSGLYTAKCSNQFGTTCSSGFINVHELTPEERKQRSLDRMPTFLVKMKDTELLRDTTICFIVKPTGDPEPKLTFFKDDAPLQEDDRICVGRQGDLVELTIHNITDSDVGTYKCVAKNKYGEAVTSGNLSVTDEKDTFRGLGSNLLEPGEEPEFTWYRDGVKFAPEDKFKVLFKDDEDSLALVFQHVRPEDAGLYTCVASTSSGRISCSAELTVQGAIHQLLREPEPPEITANLTDTEVSAGGSAMLELKVTGFPKPDVSWFKDGVEIQAGGKYRFLYEDDESIALIIKGVSADDAGQYNVIAKNDLGEATTTGRLDVNSPPKFKAKMTDTACMTDEPFTMSVTVHGSPEPQVKWYKDGQLIMESERIQMTRGENGVFTITFEKIKLEDSGAYSVVASNAIGQMSEFWNLVAHSRAKFTKTIEKVIQIKETESIDLSVEVAGNPQPEIKWSVGESGVAGKGSSFKYTCSSRTDEKITVQCANAFGTDECSADVKVLRGSKITQGLKDTKVQYDSDAEFTIKVDEFPKGKVKWFIDGIEIDGKKYEKKDDGDKHSLKIKGVTAAATVKVRAENEYGYDEQEARLDVIRKPVITRPLAESYTEVENQLLKLSVDIAANPEPEVVWFHNGQQVDADARIKIHREGTETWSLTFNVLLPSDSGDWAVKSKNEAGEAESKTVVIVEGKPEFEKKLIETVECVESDSVAFEVKVRGAPAPVIQWSLNKEEVTLTTRTSIETESTRSTTVSKLVINNTLLEDSGVITCVARNKHGECETTSQLIVQKSGPKLKLDTSPRIVEAGQEVKLTANAADGADIQWGVLGAKNKGKGGEFKLNPEKSCVVTVVASDGKSSETAEIPIRVMSRPKITGLKDVNAGPGETVTLSPKVESEPDGLEVAWYRGDEKVKDCKDADYTLTLPNVSQADAGKYTLVAKNAVGETSASAKLNILVEPPSFTRGLTDTKLREGDALTLRVRVIGVPEPKVTWELNETVIAVEGKDGQYEITTESIQSNQFGTYTVRAVNVAGEATTTGKVILVEEKPIITKGPERSKTVDESEPFTLAATVTGSPKPVVQWFKDGEPIKLEPGRVEVVAGPGDVQKLVIAKSEKLDDGVYTIEAKNPISVAKSSPSQVKVVPVPVLPTVRITAPEETQHEAEVPLEIQVEGEPSPKLTLYENDKVIEPIKIIKGANGKSATYIVKAPPRGTTVNFAAVVSNSVGKGNDQVDVKLVAPPSAPVVIESLPAEKSAVDGTNLKLQSVISGSPLPTVQWLRDNVPVPSETKEVNGKLLTAVVLDGVGAADSGVYTLVAENPSGVEKQKCDVSVLGKVDASKPQEAPAFTTSLPANVIINEGEDLVLSVGVSGNPLPDVQWGRITNPEDAGKGKPEAGNLDQVSKPVLSGAAETKLPQAGEASQSEAGSVPTDASKATLSDNSGQKAPQKPQVGDSEGDDNKAELGDSNQAGLDGSASPGDGDRQGLKDEADADKSALVKPQNAEAGQVGGAPAGTVGDAAPTGTTQDASLGGVQPGTTGEDSKKPSAGDDAGKGKQKEAVADASPKKQAQDEKPKLEPLKSVLGPNVKVEETFDGKNAIIRIPGVRQSMEGPISVQLTNPLGSKTETVNVGVRKVYSPAKIVDKFNDVHQVRGGDARFTAKVTGEPTPELEWKFEGKPLPLDRTKYNTKWDGKIGSLTVYNVGDKDLGKYTLTARNLEGSDECSGVLKELSGSPGERPEKGEKPYFLKKIADAEIYEGMSVKFTACVGGFPEPEFHWFKDDMRVYPSGRISLENNDNGLLRLIINKAGPQDLGVYKLKIFNKYGEDECTARCVIEDLLSGSGSHPDSKHAIQKPTGPPNPLPDKPIISSMTDRHLTLSWKPALRTHVDYPVTYTVEMCLANTNDWFKLRSGIKGNSTEVRNLEPGQDYKFRVRVENRIGISEPSPYAQTLRYKFDWKPTPWTPPGGDYDLNRPPHPGFTHAPKFLNKNTEQYGVPGCGIGVEWWLYGYPKPSVTFFFNGAELSSTDHVFDNNGRVVLYIDKLSEARMGWYECIGVNEHGEDRYRIHVLQGEHPRWIVRLQETHILERRDGKLTGVVTGKPQPELKWYKDWNTLGESSRIKFNVLEAETGTYRVSLTLSDSIMKDHGLYSCAASNVVGTASSSANIYIEEAEEEWRFKSYNKRLSPLSLKNKPIRDYYIFGDELGRGTQGITRHATSLHNGVSVGIKSMESGEAHKRDWMRNEFNIHSELFHPGISRVSDGYQDDRFVHIVTDLCTGGDLISNCISRGGFSERTIADYIRQLLLSLDYLHNVKSIAHLGINPLDILFSHEDSDVLKLVDFGLARRIASRLDRLDYGQPEFASPEILNGEGVGYSADLWSIGIITYLLLNGSTPFIGDNDVETMNNVKKGEWEFYNKNLSHDCQDFIRKLLAYDSRGRLDVRRALEHPWIARYFGNCDKKVTSTLVTYKSRLTKWYENASCRTIYRRNPWSGAYTHPSRMIYPPNEIDFEMGDASRDSRSYAFGVPNYPRPDLNVEVGVIKSESHYQNGPDTYLLQLRDSGFPARLRQYMKVAASRSPSFALQLKSQAYDRNNPIIRERRRFQEVMDEEVKDELTQGKEWRGEPRRLRHEVGIHLDTTAQADAIVALHKDGTPAFIREGPNPVVRANIGDNVILKCQVDGLPEPTVQWFKCDLVLGKTPRIDPSNTHLIIENFNETDYGVYKLTARNTAGSSTVKFRIVQGHYAKQQASSVDYTIETKSLPITQESMSFAEEIRDGHFGSWSLGSTSSGNLAQRISSSVDDLNIRTSLAHTGLLRLKSLVNDNDSLYLVYNETKDDGYIKLTDKYIKDGVYNEADISSAVQQILSVLSYIQWRGLQLLNLNLDNILTDSHGNIKLFDTSSIVRVAKIGTILPIPATVTQFTPPELLSGDNVHMTTDVWSIGCLVYTLLSGCWPFAGEDGKQTKGNIQFVRYRFEPLYVSSTPEATRFLMMIFKKCPMKRPTIEEVQDSRWLSTQDSVVRRRTAASFKSLGLEKLLSSSSFVINN